MAASRSLPAGVAFVLERFVAELRARFGERVQEVTLFGSQARGEAHEESDVDVLVVIRGLTEDERRDVLDMAYRVDASQEELAGLSPLVYSEAQAADLRARERRLMRDIAREGIAL